MEAEGKAVGVVVGGGGGGGVWVGALMRCINAICPPMASAINIIAPPLRQAGRLEPSLLSPLSRADLSIICKMKLALMKSDAPRSRTRGPIEHCEYNVPGNEAES